MKRTPLFALILLLAFTFMSPLPVAAADGEGVPPEGDVARVRKKVEALRAWRLTEELKLDDETSARLFPAIREADEQRLNLERDNRQLARSLNQELSASPVDQDRVNAIIDQLVENRSRQASNEQNHIKRVRRILDPEMTARYLLFQVRFQRELRKLMAERAQGRRDERRTAPGRRPEGRDRGEGGYGGMDGGMESGGGGDHGGGR